VLTPCGELELDIPRGRKSTFEPELVAKYQRCCRASTIT
jgi:transposase-like protein